jgi:hypothetical protein
MTPGFPMVSGNTLHPLDPQTRGSYSIHFCTLSVLEVDTRVAMLGYFIMSCRGLSTGVHF